jgi:gamma-glutamyltranspeptidase/glutathione hydrolase
MVVSDAPLATRAGVEVLRQGGNAIDAAVATAFALAVVYPEAGNLGGGGYLVARFADGQDAALDFREAAPLAAWHDMYLDSNGAVTEASTIGHRAAGVPGAVAGLWEAHRTHGRLPWRRLLEPSIRLAKEGFAVNERFARVARGDSALLCRFEGSRRLFFPDGTPPAPGSLWQNPELGATLERIARDGAREFYEGETAELIVHEMSQGGGLIIREDLARYRALWRQPVRFSYRGYRVLSAPPSSSGGVTLAILMGILEGYDLPLLGSSAEALHLKAEAMRRAYADRNEYLADPDFVRVDVDSLISPRRTAHWRMTINTGKATPSDRIARGTLNPVPEGTETTHLSVVDAQGNAVALTTTVNSLFGCGVTVRGGGFLLNNEMDDFASRPGWPNMFGLVQGEQNAIQPGKRMLSSMTPTVVSDSTGRLLLVTGGRGGAYITTSVFHVLSNVIDLGMDLPTAVTAPRVHHQHYPDILQYEPGALSADQLQDLQRRRHELKESRGSGSTCSIIRTPAGWVGFGDPRSGGSAEGY